MTTDDRPTVFISYSHKDQRWKEMLTPHLKVLEQVGRIDIWCDTKIDGGDQWYREIKEAIDRAAVAVCLISADYLASDFCVKEEIPYLLERRDRTVLVILPTLLHPCLWEVVEWLKNTQMIPRDSKSISADFRGNENEAFRQVAKSVLDILDDPQRKRPEPPAPTWPAPDRVDTRRLPVTGSELFGRQRELQMLDEAWETGGTRVVSLVAWGGVGKTNLVNKWVAQMAADNYRGARRVYAWSFYSQGTNERVTSADLFINNALEFFGDPAPAAGSPWNRGERLARLVRREKTLLVLDGLEPLQSPHAHERGRIKDPALCTLLSGLARENPGLCLITTRERVTDLDDFPEGAVHKDLEQISDEAGRALLRVGGAQGTDEELERTVRDFGNHALAVQLLAVYLHDIPGHHVPHASEIPDLDIPAEAGRHPRRMMAAFERRFGEGPEVELLRMLGLFDRPADGAALAALRAAPPVPGLAEHLQKLSERGWLRVVEKLRRARLVAPASQHHADDEEEELDAHPLVREHFAQQLRERLPGAWREANGRLYEHFRDTTPEFPDTLEGLAPLYAAVAHGCAAGRHREALEEVLVRRVHRGEMHFSMRNLGAAGAELNALSDFFELPWEKPVPGLTEALEEYVLAEAGFGLRALGRLKEAAQPMRTALGLARSRGDWDHAAVTAKGLSDTYLTTGDLPESLDYARQSVEFADRSGDRKLRMSNWTTLANTFHQAGRLSEAEEAFGEAERLQQQDSGAVYSYGGFKYCDFLLGQGKYAEVRARAARNLEWVTARGWILAIALDRLSIGRAHLLEYERQGGAGRLDDAEHYLRQAVDGLLQAGNTHYLPRGLLARAELYRVRGEFDRAQADLGKALSIAERSGMVLYKADCHLEHARLCLARGEAEEARAHLDTARELVGRTGYHLRDGDLEEIGRGLEGA